jgi:hypothetical protein
LEKLEAFSYNLSMEMTASPASQKPDQMPSERPNEQRATAVETPRNILGKADAQWKKQRGSTPVDVRHLPPHQAFGQTTNWGWFAASSWQITSTPPPPSIIIDTALERFAIMALGGRCQCRQI